MNETQVDTTQAGATAQDGGANGSQNVADLKDILGPVFGTQFKSDEDALKSVEQAKNMSGKVGQLEQTVSELKGQLASSKNPEIQAQLQELAQTVKQGQFFSEHPEFNTPEAKALIGKFGGDPAQVVEDPVFKSAFDAYKVRSEVEKSKSVIHSNPRLGQVTDKLTQARDAANNKDYAQSADLAVQAVLEAYEKPTP